MPEVTLEWLNQNARQLTKKHWGMNEIPKIVIDLDRKLDWNGYVGYYCGDIKTVCFNSTINKKRTLKEIKRTLLHELCHWYLHTSGMPHKDSDERFARELIRVGLGRRHNKDDQAVLAAKIARNKKKNEFFEIIERNEETTISVRLRHHRKNKDDFKKDLANTLIKIHNQKEEDDSIYPADVAEKMAEWYGYKLEPIAVYGIELSASGSYSGDIGDRDDIAQLLTNLDFDMNIINKKLKNAASEE